MNQKSEDYLREWFRAGPLPDEPDSLHDFLAAVPLEHPRTTRGRWAVLSIRAPRVLAGLAAAVVVLAIGGAILFGLMNRANAPITGGSPSPTATASESNPAPTGSPEPTATASGSNPAIIPSPVPSATSPANGAWTGLRWSAPSVLPDAVNVGPIVAWNGGFMAAGQIQGAAGQEAAFWRSSDGTTWTRVGINEAAFAGETQVRELVATPSGLVASGTVGQPACTGLGEGSTCGLFPVMVWTSPDGVTWTRIADLSTFKGATIDGVTFGAQGLVAVGDTGWDAPAIWVSTTGAAWQRASLPTATFKDAHVSGVSATSSGYLLAGGIGNSAPTSGGVLLPDLGVAAAWTSPDGRTWTKDTVNRVDGVGSSLGSIYIGARGMVAVGEATGGKTSAAWVSTDGRTWQPVNIDNLFGGSAAPSGAPTLPALDIADDGTHLVALDTNQQLTVRIWISSDGVTWQQLPASGATDQIPSSSGGGSYYTACLAPGGLMIVVGEPAGGSGQTLLWRVTALP